MAVDFPTPFPSRTAFMAVLSAIQAQARTAFGGHRSVHDREDAETEVAARVWERFAAAPTVVATERLAASAVAAVRSDFAHSHG